MSVIAEILCSLLVCAHFGGTANARCMDGDVDVTEPVLQWSLGKKVSSPPATQQPAQVVVSNSPCSRDVKILAAQFATGCKQCVQ